MPLWPRICAGNVDGDSNTSRMTKLVSADVPNAVVYLYLGSLILLYVVVAVHTPMTLYADAGHDDALFALLGRYLAEGQWLGPFSQFTLMKGPGYPAFLALSNWLSLSATLAHALFHCLAVTFFVAVAHRFLRSYRPLRPTICASSVAPDVPRCVAHPQRTDLLRPAAHSSRGF